MAGTTFQREFNQNISPTALAAGLSAGAFLRAPRYPFPGVAGSIGDSRLVGVGATTTLSFLPQVFAGVYSRGLIWPEATYACAATDTQTSGLDSQITTLLAAGTPDFCYVLSGANDAPQLAGTSISSSGQVTNITAAWTRLLNHGIVPIHIADLPRTIADTTAAMVARNRATNRKLERTARGLGVLFYDPTYLLADPANASGDPLSGLFCDGMNLSEAGALKVGRWIGQQLLLLCPGWQGLDLPFSAGDIISGALANVGQNYVTNPMLLGSVAVSGVTGASGNLPTGVSMQNNSGVPGTGPTVVCSIVTGGTYGERQLQMVFTAGVTAGQHDILFPFSTVAAGSYRGAMDYDVATTGSPGATDQVQMYVSYSPTYAGTPRCMENTQGWPGAWAGRVCLPLHARPANADGSTNVLGARVIVSASGGTRTIKLSLPSYRAA